MYARRTALSANTSWPAVTTTLRYLIRDQLPLIRKKHSSLVPTTLPKAVLLAPRLLKKLYKQETRGQWKQLLIRKLMESQKVFREIKISGSWWREFSRSLTETTQVPSIPANSTKSLIKHVRPLVFLWNSLGFTRKNCWKRSIKTTTGEWRKWNCTTVLSTWLNKNDFIVRLFVSFETKHWERVLSLLVILRFGVLLLPLHYFLFILIGLSQRSILRVK